MASIVRGLLTTKFDGVTASGSALVTSPEFQATSSEIPITFSNDMSFNILVRTGTISGSSVTLFWGLIDNAVNIVATDFDTVEVQRHIGFFVENGVLYASNANGSNQTKTDITSGITIGANNIYRVEWDASTNAKFFVNDVLKATHTTNRPTTNSIKMQIGFDNGTSGSQEADWTIGNGYLMTAII